MMKMGCRWIATDNASIGPVNTKDELGVILDSSGPIIIGANGLTIKPAGITNSMLAGFITDDKLASKYLYADGSRTATGPLSMGGYKIINVGAPESATDVATKSYVDGRITGLTWKPPVLDSINYIIANSGVAPTGTPTNDGEKCLNTADNILYVWDAANATWNSSTLSNGDRYLFNLDGSDTSGNSGTYTHDNNIYQSDGSTISQIAPVDGWALFRESDGSGFTYLTNENEWVKFTGLGEVICGNGLYKVGNTINVGNGHGIYTDADTVNVDVSSLCGNGIVDDGSGAFTLDTTIAGDGLSIDFLTKVLSVNVSDGLTIVTDNIQVAVADFAGFGLEDDGSNNLQVSSVMAGNGLTGGSGAPFSIGPGNGISVLADNIQLGPLSGAWVATDGVNLYPIQGVADPTNPQDVATKAYVDSNVSAINNRQVIQYTLTATDITNKYVILPNVPANPAAVVLVVRGAPGLAYGLDYQIDASYPDHLTWASLGLDGLLVAGDVLTVIYDI